MAATTRVAPPSMMSLEAADDVKKYQMMNYDDTIIVNPPAHVMACRVAFMSSPWLPISSNCRGSSDRRAGD